MVCRVQHTIIITKIFDTLIDSFLKDKVGIADDFLSASLAANLKANLDKLFALQQFRSAGTGNEIVIAHDKTVRGDLIYWLDRSHGDIYENDFFDLIDTFVKYLNETCYTGITGYEFHYALYDKGRFYKKHLDQFRSDGSRQYSMIIYLNPDWKLADGGELCIHQNGTLRHISPVNRKGVFFKSSELEHEVLLTNRPRMSITGWLKVD